MSVFVMLHPLGRNSHQNEGPPHLDMAWQSASEDVVIETFAPCYMGIFWLA